jgi:hypothetical protein
VIENLCVNFNGRVCGVDASATAGIFFVPAWMRCVVSSQKKTCVAAGSGLNQREPMRFPFQDRSAIVMWTQTQLALATARVFDHHVRIHAESHEVTKLASV